MSLLGRTMRNRTIGVKVLDDSVINGADTDPSRDPYEGVDVVAAYAEIAKDLVTHTAFTIGGVFAVCKIIERLCK